MKGSLSNITDSYIKDSGCATKYVFVLFFRKIDYIKFKLEARDRNGVKVEFGSGLNSRMPSRGPLERTHKRGLKGDISVELNGSGY